MNKIMYECPKLTLRIIVNILSPIGMIGCIIWAFVGLIQFVIGYHNKGYVTVYWESDKVDQNQSQGVQNFLQAWGYASTILLVLTVIRLFPCHQFGKVEWILKHIACIKGVICFFGFITYLAQAVSVLCIIVGSTLLSYGIKQSDYIIKLGRDSNILQSWGIFILLIWVCSFLTFLIANEVYIRALDVSGYKGLIDIIPKDSDCCCIKCLNKIDRALQTETYDQKEGLNADGNHDQKHQPVIRRV